MTDIVLLDGGMGQELVRRSADPAHPQWGAWVMMNEPERVQGLHEDYLRAGARVITLNAYSINRSRLAAFGMAERLAELQQTAIDLARRARDAVGVDAAIAGCLPPLIGSYHPELLPPDPELLAEYREIVALQAPFVDVLLCETMSKASEARMAATAAAEAGKPVWVAWTLDEDLAPDGAARLRSGETIDQAIAALDGLAVEALLFDCCPPEAITAGLPALAGHGRAFGGYANAFTPIPQGFVLGETVDMLDQRTDLGPEAYAEHVMGWVASGASIVGGCCEIGPEHIAEIARRLETGGHSIVKEL